MFKRKNSKQNYKRFSKNRKIHTVFLVLFTLLSLITFYSILTNPYSLVSIIKNPHQTTVQNNQILLEDNFELKVYKSPFFSLFGYAKSGIHIIINGLLPSLPAKGNTEQEIIEYIYNIRFDTTKPFLISGDHFSVFYPRNLGIFYYPLLDPKTVFSEKDWIGRQEILLQSTAYALEVFDKGNTLSTTIVPVSKKGATLINIYNYPSDTLYSILFSLYHMQHDDFSPNIHFINDSSPYKLYTKSSSDKLLEKYNYLLRKLLFEYTNKAYDKKTGLVKKNASLSSMNDLSKRQSAFYDNVIFWKTADLAMKLNIIKENDVFLKNYKKRILEAFWNEKEGHFLEDLSKESINNHYYCSDWLIILSTGFLDINNEKENKYYIDSINYIRNENIDEPFGLKYHKKNRREKQHLIPAIFLPSYGGSAIWSHLGMEYIKTLILLFRETNEDKYLNIAQNQLKSYEENILKYRGYPELYDKNGKMLSTVFYKSIHKTGWVVNYVQTKKLFEMVQKESI